jgi:hypothetical protein
MDSVVEPGRRNRAAADRVDRFAATGHNPGIAAVSRTGFAARSE